MLRLWVYPDLLQGKMEKGGKAKVAAPECVPRERVAAAE